MGSACRARARLRPEEAQRPSASQPWASSSRAPTASLAKAYVNLERTNAALPVAQQRLASAQAALAQAESAQARAEADRGSRRVDAEAKARAHNEAVAQKLAVAQANEQRAKEKLAQSSQALVTSQDALDAYAAEVFQGAGTESQLGMVFGATSPQDFADRIVMADTASEVASDTIDRLATMTADNTATRAYLTSVRGEIAELKRQAEIALQGSRGGHRRGDPGQGAGGRRQEQRGHRDEQCRRRQDRARLPKVAADRRTPPTWPPSAPTSRPSSPKPARSRLACRRSSSSAPARRASRSRSAWPSSAPSGTGQDPCGARQGRCRREAKGNGYTPRTPPPVRSRRLDAVQLPHLPGQRPDDLRFRHALAPGPAEVDAPRRPRLGASPAARRCMPPRRVEVIRAGWRASGWGNQVVIDHGIHRGVDLVTTYNHLSSIVKFGGSVNRGQLIGYSGTTGYSTGLPPALRCRTRTARPVDPRGWL